MSLKTIVAGALSAGMLAAAAAAAAADQPSPLHAPVAQAAALGDNASALTYWVDRADGRHVVTTIDTVVADPAGGPEKHAVVRFAAILQPGQSQIISVPADDAARGRALRIRSIGDTVELKTLPAGSSDVSLN